ncbi:MAG: CoA activase [Spirochaetes bacterium]|nr:CoA activase [Spirochaetota bacterium]
MKEVIGIDIGSIAVSIAIVNENYEITYSDYTFHNGEIEKTLFEMFAGINSKSITNIAITSSTPDIFTNAVKFDMRISYIEAVKRLYPDAASLLIVGGEKFGLIQFDDKKNYLNYKSNTSCAAGTGSFLDQQARRLNISSISEFSKIAHSNTGAIPKIASRCAVFAKTDLIHAQQEGYSAEEICDGLCYGLSKNITDTLFTSKKPGTPLVFAGGVSKNKAVIKHLKNLLSIDIITDDFSHLYGAAGACFTFLKEEKFTGTKGIDLPASIKTAAKEKEYHHEQLKLKLSDYPDFITYEKFDFQSTHKPASTPVETDIYVQLEEGKTYDVYLGIDIGSTSTKAAIIDEDRNVLIGLYTRTSGRPLEACQTIFETINYISNQKKAAFRFNKTATTGSGRKFIGSIIGADLALDEITAHAAAALQLDVDVDTIIEIGGQDAKFTTLKDGRVTFSIMNNVCAAGTGSFIEEQAKKLNVPLADYSKRAEAVKSPLSSDRCTVFMERDINHFISDGFSVDEVLASVLHSVRENYLTKVAIPQNIGSKIFFQGATAKNRALVAAFEQKLNKPIIVSKYCHLTGAIGCALKSMEIEESKTAFRGIDLYRENIPIHTEICNLCNNHCKIRIADINGEKCAYGFLCGRDYETKQFVNRNTSGYDLLKSRAMAFSFKSKTEFREQISIGIPYALYLVEEMPLWRKFFDNLSIRTITSEPHKDAVREGKLLSGAEFCAPMAAIQGHTKYLFDKCDFIFIPVYLEQKGDLKNEIRRNYCYYSQYASSIVKSIDLFYQKDKILSPVIRSLQNSLFMKNELLKMLKPLLKENISFLQVSAAYDNAFQFFTEKQSDLKKIFIKESSKEDNLKVILLGRPYTILNRHMNNNIPEIFGRQGIKAFYQDMLTYDENSTARIKPMLDFFHWHYAVKILESAEYIANTKGLYPVFITSFKCSPDSFTIDYFKKIMDSYNKPYLILQLDEHDSSVGYETRIEAAVRSFKNHFEKSGENESIPVSFTTDVIYKKTAALKSKTILFPNWDKYTCPLICSILNSKGFKAEPIDESEKTIFGSLQINTGQCIPLTAILFNAIEHIKHHKLKAEDCAIWIFDSSISCNIRMYPYYMEKLLENYEEEYRKLSVFNGEFLFKDFGISTSVEVYFAYLFGGFLRKAGCKIRPYEVNRGETDKVLEKCIALCESMFKYGIDKEKIAEDMVAMLEKIETVSGNRTKVAIFGDLYARDNDIFNMNLIRVIEENGGEAITTPYSDYGKIISSPYFKKWLKEGRYLDSATGKVLKETVKVLEGKYVKIFKRIVEDIDHDPEVPAENILPLLDVQLENTGESMDNVLKIFSLIKNYPDINLFVQTNPAYCCPSLVTQAMAERIEKVTSIPVLTIEYDGTGANVNESIIPYLKYPRKKNSSN